MKQSARLFYIVAVLALPFVTLGAVTSKLNKQSEHSGSLTATEGTRAGLRGGLHAAKVPATLKLQVSKTQASNLKKTGHKATKHSHSLLQRRFHTNHRAAQKQNLTEKVGTGICRGSKLRWWIIIKKKCFKAFGKNSKWDRDRQDGKCAEAWNDCNTGFYAVCCTQPLGPRNMDAYCAKQNMTSGDANSTNATKDKACQVQDRMKDVKNAMSGIKDTIKLLGADVIQATFAGPSPGPAPMPAPAVVMPPPGLQPMGAVSPAPAPMVFGPAPPNVMETRCSMLTELTRQASERIKAIKTWAEDGGIEKHEQHHKHHKDKHHRDNAADDRQEQADSAEAADPDLFFTVKGVLQVGKKLDHMLKATNFCTRGPEEDDDDDDDVEEDLAKDPTEDSEDDEEEEEEPVTTVNETSLLELLNWEGDMNNAVDKFEKEVHPHGFKWWRYRYEYTIVESIVLAFSVMVMYLCMWILHGVSFFESHKFYKTGITQRLDRYAWGYFVFHAAALMIMVTVAYMLYIPWGKQNIFNIFAEAFHDFIDGQFNVPFLGYSWLYMVLDVQFQLFVCFAMYSLFLVMISHKYKKALEDFKALGDERDDLDIEPCNKQLYNHLESIMKRRVESSPEHINLFTSLKLSFKGVQTLHKPLEAGWNDFRLHLYLTDGLGKSLEYLVQVSLTTNVFLACSSLVVALLAHHYQVAFMYFLPGFVVLGFAMFIASYFVSRHFRALSEKDDHNTPAKYVTVHSYCRAIQVMLYCVFFSFSRLLLSNDIFEFYPMVYISALLGLAVCMALLMVFAGRLIKETVCALILPPHLEQDRFKTNLEQVVFWHTTQKCHECGAQQFPLHASLSHEWAGRMPVGERKGADGDTARPYSFRG